MFAFISLTVGKQIDPTTAKTVGQNFIATRVSSKTFGKTGNTLDLVYTSAATSNAQSQTTPTNYFYVFNVNQSQGFVIISADDNVLSVLGYSDQGAFNPNNIPENVSKWLENYKDQIRYVIENNIPATQTIISDWSNLKSGNQNQILFKKGSVTPLIQTHWDQSPNYNAQCPYDNAYSQRTVTGCVATAMAQVMKFWNYPASGTGFHSYNHATYGTLSANFGSTTYQWSSMPNSVTSANSAVATLMYHCGVSVDMGYGVGSTGGSSAYVAAAYSPITNCTEYALKTYFGYSSSLQGVIRANYTETQWIGLLETELDAGRPVIHTGSGTHGGHCFVCDGYDNNNYMHMNWGWSGNSDGYFQISALNPAALGTGGGSGGFNNYQSAIIGIKPPTSAVTYDMRLYASVTPSASSISYGQSFTVSTNIANFGTNSFTGDYCAAIFDNSYNFVGYVDSVINSTIQGGYHYTNGFTFSNSGLLSMLPGTYYIGIFYRPTGGNWRIVANNSSYTNLVQMTVTYSSNIELYSSMNVTPGTTFTVGNSASVNLNLKNTSTSTYYGQYSVALVTISGGSLTIAQMLSTISESSGLPPNYVYNSPYLTFNTTAITVTPGSYLLAAIYKPSTSSTWYIVGSTSYQNPINVTVQNPTIPPDIYEPNNSPTQAYSLALNYTSNLATVNTEGSNIHTGTDYDNYKISLQSGYTYTITARLQDKYSSNNGKTYTVDAMFSYSTDTITWSQTYDDVMPNNITVNGAGTVYFLVSPYFTGETGNYRLDISVTRSPILSSAKDITAFTVPGIVGSATINNSNATVTATVTFASNLTSLAPIISVSSFASVNPASGVTQNFTNPVTYTVTAQDASTKQWTVTITKQTTGINNVASNESINIYPNPSKDFINIDLSNSDAKVSSIKISDVQGQIISEQIVSNQIERISVSNFADGIYILQLNSDKGILTQKIIIGK